jgi:prephenate dehydratase
MISKITIIGGTGKFGQFFNKIFEENNIKTALLGRKNYNTLKEEVESSDVIMLSIPQEVAEKTYNDLKPLMKKNHVIIDISSIMSINCNFAKEMNCETVFLHPLFAPSIVEHKNAKYILAKSNTEMQDDNKILAEFIELLKAKGSTIKKTTIGNHEKMMAYIQALSHFNSILLAKILAESNIPQEEIEEFTTTFFRLEFDAISRIFAQPSEIYAAIQFNNPKFKEVMLEYENNFNEIKEIVITKDYEAYAKTFEKINENLGKILKNSFEESQHLIKTFPSKKVKIGFLGPSGSYSEIAASNYVAHADLVAFDTISDVIKSVNLGKIEFGVVPIENSIQGSIAETVDGIYVNKLFIIKAIIVPINHCCAALTTDIKPEIILSHPQALGQCSDFIAKEFPNAKLVQTLSTAQAFKKIAEESLLNAVAIGTENAAEKYGLKILRKNIQNNENNETKFVVISKNFDLNSKGNTTSIVVSPIVDKPGLLFSILEHLKNKNINLSKIESRPSKLKLGTYIFHMDLQGNFVDQNIKEAIAKIQENNEIIFLGSYNQSRVK